MSFIVIFIHSLRMRVVSIDQIKYTKETTLNTTPIPISFLNKAAYADATIAALQNLVSTIGLNGS